MAEKKNNKLKKINELSEKKHDIKETEKVINDKETEKNNIKKINFSRIINSKIYPYIAIGIALFFLGVMLSAQVKSISSTTAFAQGKREAELIDDLATLQRSYNDLKEKYDQKAKVVDEYQTSASTNNTLIASMKEEIKQLSVFSGTTNVTGEGITITLKDGDKSVDDSSRSDTLVHDSDILTVVNELKAAGAEAISVNNQRIVSNTAIRCVGPVIQINYQKVAAPFVIKAIGNAQYLESALTIKNGVVDILKQLGVGVTLVRESNIKILSFDKAINFKTALPTE